MAYIDFVAQNNLSYCWLLSPSLSVNGWESGSSVWCSSLSPLLSPVKAVVKLAHWLFWPVVFCQTILTTLALDTVLSQECGQILGYSA